MSSSTIISPTIFLGTFIHNASLEELAVFEKAMVGVDDQGIIRFVQHGQGVEEFLVNGSVESLGETARDWIRRRESEEIRIHDITAQETNQFWFPGFVGKWLLILILCWPQILFL